jgi:hypothetical protein
MTKMASLDIGWYYWRYERPPRMHSPQEDNGDDNQIADLITEYSGW